MSYVSEKDTCSTTFNILAKSLAHLIPLFIHRGNQYNHSSASPFRIAYGKTLYRQCHPFYCLHSGGYVPVLDRNTSLCLPSIMFRLQFLLKIRRIERSFLLHQLDQNKHGSLIPVNIVCSTQRRKCKFCDW